MCRRGGGTAQEGSLSLQGSSEPPREYCLPARGRQPPQGLQEAARILEALQVLLVGGDLQGSEKNVVRWPILTQGPLDGHPGSQATCGFGEDVLSPTPQDAADRGDTGRQG